MPPSRRLVQDRLDLAHLPKTYQPGLAYENSRCHYQLFSFFCAGLRFGDLARPRWKNVVQDGDTIGWNSHASLPDHSSTTMRKYIRVPSAGFEPAACGLGNRRSIP